MTEPRLYMRSTSTVSVHQGALAAANRDAALMEPKLTLALGLKSWFNTQEFRASQGTSNISLILLREGGSERNVSMEALSTSYW